MSGADGPDEYGLGPRAVQVLKLMCHGLETDQIARRLGLTSNTVKHYRVQLLKKTGSLTPCHLGVWAAERGYQDRPAPPPKVSHVRRQSKQPEVAV